MTNPIPKSSLWTTPADLDHLAVLLNGCGSAEEQRLAWYGAMMAFNLAHNLFEQAQKESV